MLAPKGEQTLVRLGVINVGKCDAYATILMPYKETAEGFFFKIKAPIQIKFVDLRVKYHKIEKNAKWIRGNSQTIN